MRRWRLAVGLPCALALVAVASLGCSSVRWPGSSEGPEAEPQRKVTLTYRTESDRLNLLARGRSDGPQLASYHEPHAAPVPEFTQSTLRIEYPHPHGREGHALATAVFEASPDDAPSGISALWSKVTGSSDDEEPESGNAWFRETWTLDVPRWQLDRVLGELEKSGFFRRSKTLGAKVEVSTQIDGVRFSKPFTSVAELDSLILSIRSRGRLVDGTPRRGGPDVGSGARPFDFHAPPRSGGRIKRLPPVGT
jgi:hypothetical protein